MTTNQQNEAAEADYIDAMDLMPELDLPRDRFLPLEEIAGMVVTHEDYANWMYQDQDRVPRILYLHDDTILHIDTGPRGQAEDADTVQTINACLKKGATGVKPTELAHDASFWPAQKPDIARQYFRQVISEILVELSDEETAKDLLATVSTTDGLTAYSLQFDFIIDQRGGDEVIIWTGPTFLAAGEAKETDLEPEEPEPGETLGQAIFRFILEGDSSGPVPAFDESDRATVTSAQRLAFDDPRYKGNASAQKNFARLNTRLTSLSARTEAGRISPLLDL